MKQDELLINRLRRYGQSPVYPFHMPGHKRLAGGGELGMALEFPNPFEVDITEVAGFDNLHHPEKLLKESMEWAAGVYGADRTYYLVNGSSSGILAGISSAVKYGGRLLMSRNCHKSAYHSVFLRGLAAQYIYPQEISDLGIQGGILPGDVEKLLKMYPDTQAVMVVSPTYDGIVSDIHSIAEIVHRAGLPLIVDEAHGAHFRYDKAFPASAVDCGADLVIQSIHKTLPSLTQTALLHVNLNRAAGGPFVDAKGLERYLQIYQSSSPSYVLMASIENAVFQMNRMKGPESQMKRYLDGLGALRKRLGELRCLRLADRELIGRRGVYDLDISKVVVSTANTALNGAGLDQILRAEYGLEMEMCGADYVTAITSVMDSGEGMKRLEQALVEIDGRLGRAAGGAGAGSWTAGSRDVGSRTAGSRAAGSQAAGSRAAGSQGVGNQAAGSRDVGSQAAGSQGVGNQAAGSRDVGSQAAGSQGVGKQAAGSRDVGSRAAGSRAAGSRAAGSQAAGSQAAGSRAAGSRAAGSRDVAARPPEPSVLPRAKTVCTIAQAMDGETRCVALKDSCGCISGEYIYIYPPGIPIVAPGEEISRDVLELIFDYMRQGLPVQGPEDVTMGQIKVV